jgi:hypothetical protein
MVYVYAITDAPHLAAEAPRGLADEPLAVRAHESIAAVISRHAPGNRPSPVAENLWRHEQVVEWLMQAHAVLPARFGTTFADDVKLDAALAAHHGPLAAGLERVRGCVELGLRVMWEPAPQPSPAPPANSQPGATTGREYMAARLAEEQRRRDERRRAETLADALDPSLRGLAADSTRQILPAPQLPLTAAYLVPRELTTEFKRRVEELAAAHPAVRLVCTGPWPPYHFVPPIGDTGKPAP